MERKTLESAAANYSYLKGLLLIPVGIVLIVAALGNWKWGPLRHAWVFVACVLAAGLAGLVIARYYSERYGRVTPSTRQRVRASAAVSIGVGLMVGVGFLAAARVGGRRTGRHRQHRPRDRRSGGHRDGDLRPPPPRTHVRVPPGPRP
jgi:hypothetical protein